MSFDTTLADRRPLPLRQRPSAALAAVAARLLATRSPHRITRVLTAVRTGARPATADEALAARDAVVRISRRCATDSGCLPRSLATVLLCRLRGTWPTWCTGVRTQPFSAHAWVVAGGQPVGEPRSAGTYTPVVTVPPAGEEPAVGDVPPAGER
ncbi:lasso peptide biosynthesis B2 protein [Streptomyces iconiensis]|uniref:Lasso peptide biosynthesis B2 protein n=1 Tax=Streptomyces iconiensis TaxID=1384038 RepID=A0ABT6ZQU5_9ACTN|nr:lasso peptide biosynthesis B2 protein [Streptomyces iconiensis]MDJ1131435.1 lasso peptide biosynthesis B2 protein [Streptomyces iconiensis]